MLYDYFVSAVRTIMPYVVAALISWGLLPADLSGAAILVFTGLIFSGYYLLARFLEGKWPWLGWLLGRPTPPTYAERLPSRVIEG